MEKVKVLFWSKKNEDGKDIQDMKFATQHSAAVDLKVVDDVTISSKSYKVISTGLYVSIPDGYYMKVFPRSGISAKTDLIFKNTVGIIDSDYRGREIFIMYYNLGNNDITFNKGERVAQAIIEKLIPVEYVPVSSIDDLKSDGFDRGGGLGHTGKF